MQEEVREILTKHFHKSSVELTRLKAQAIIMYDDGLGIKKIGYYVNRNVKTIYRWIREFDLYGISSIFSKLIDNENASKLTREQKDEIKKTLILPPNDYGLPCEFWSVSILKEYIKEEFGIVYESDSSYHFLMHYGNLSFKYPETSSPRRNEEYIRKRSIEIKDELKNSSDVYFVDETRIQLDSEIRRAWLQRGKKTIVKTERSMKSQNYIGFLNYHSGKCIVEDIENGNEREIIRVLQKVFKNTKAVIIWDNARWHKSKLLRSKLGDGNEFSNLRLINTPPYAPELNPIEKVWKFAKEKLANRYNHNLDVVKQEFIRIISSSKFHYKF